MIPPVFVFVGSAHENRSTGRHKGDGRDGGRGGGDQIGNQRAEAVFGSQEHRHLLWGVHQEIATREGRPTLAGHGILRCR